MRCFVVSSRTSLSLDSPANPTVQLAEPISACNHCRVLGIPDDLVPEFFKTFLESSSRQQKDNFVRKARASKRNQLVQDTVSELTPAEVGVCVLLMASCGCCAMTLT